MFPAMWSILIVLKEEIDIYLTLLIIYGSFIMRSAGCIINDIIDKKIDKNVNRTKLRPLVSGNLDNTDAIILLIIFLSIALSILLNLNTTSIFLGILVLPLIFIYPFIKRFVYIPQLFLAVVFNFSVLISWTAASGVFELQSLILYVACIFWTLGYDTIYAYQDIKDDKKIGVKSLAIYLEKDIKFYTSVFFIIFLIFFFYIGIKNNLNMIFFSTIILFTLIIISKIFKKKKLETKNCHEIFVINSWYGFFITLVLFFNYI
tara:strand:+ start:15917 stop:16699 length:783 start_codon:yes stop_codon:yes gene_type:complete